MEIKIDKRQLSLDQFESLENLDNSLKKVIIDVCSSEIGKSLKVEYGSALTNGGFQDTYKLIHNASFELRSSHIIVDKVSTLLKLFFQKYSFPNAILITKLTFSKKIAEKEDALSTYSDKNANQNREEKLEFIPSDPKFSFNQIVLPPRVYNDLMNAIKIIKYRDLIYNQWGYGDIEPYARCVINMYGPAGTGKTMCAHAIANHIGKKLLALNYSEIESKYLGEAAKNLAKAFEIAEESNSVLFFDEADSFLGKRVQNVTQSSDQALNSLRSQMLILLEKFDGIVIFATNLISNFDDAFMSRIQKHIKFELPDTSQRVEIIKKQIPVRLPLSQPLNPSELEEISKFGEGLSGREIKNAILELYLSRANESNTITFSPQDFADALALKVESNKQIETEKNRIIKERIVKKLTEKTEENVIQRCE